LHGDCHNLYGHYNTKATYEALVERKDENKSDAPIERPFILTRSFYAGT